MTPEKHIRKAIVDNLTVQLGVPVTDEVLPLSASNPSLYVLIHSQGRTRFAATKQNYEWKGTVTLSIVKINEKGYISSVELDEADSKICKFMDSIEIPGLRVGTSTFVDSASDNIEGPTNTFGRRHVIYELWVNRIT